MSEFLAAVDDMKAIVARGGTTDEMDAATAVVYRTMPDAATGERADAQRRLTADMGAIHPVAAAHFARVCGAIVENSGDPLVSGPAILGLVPRSLDGTARFYKLCAEREPAAGEDDDPPNPEELAEKHFAVLYEAHPEEAFAYAGGENVALAAIAHLSRSKRLRDGGRAGPDLLKKSLALDQAYRAGHSFLTKMLLTLDDEPLLVLDADQGRGYRVTISGISDNFSLHTHLMGHLIGDPAKGLIAAKGFDTAAIRYAMTHIADNAAPTLTGAFNLWNWTGVKTDGTLPTGNLDSDAWIWNEGVPADILHFEGTRVIVLGPPAYARHWHGGLIFGGMKTEFSVDEVLPEPEVRAWLMRLGAAPRPGA